MMVDQRWFKALLVGGLGAMNVSLYAAIMFDTMEDTYEARSLTLLTFSAQLQLHWSIFGLCSGMTASRWRANGRNPVSGVSNP